MDFEHIRRDFPIDELMARMGCDMTHRGYMYRAPYRDDHDPSMHVDRARNVWCDYGLTGSDGKPVGGGNIELVKMVEGVSSNKEAAERILELFREVDLDLTRPSSQSVRNSHTAEPAITVISTLNMVLSKALRYYLQQRCIDHRLASRWCHEVDFRIDSTGRRIFAIGFPTDRGTWALRNSFYKGSNGQGVSTIVKDRSIVGPVDDEVRQFFPDAGKGRVAVFEGFMDYLSWLTINKTAEAPCDAVVLNSTSNVAEAIPFLSTHDSIECWLDNDDAGRRCLSVIQDRCPVTIVDDMSSRYSRYNDLNDWLVCETELLEKSQKQRRGLSL